jgi:hypothetical protein
MDNEVISQAEGDEEVLCFEIPDHALSELRALNRMRSLSCIVPITGTTAGGHNKSG